MARSSSSKLPAIAGVRSIAGGTDQGTESILASTSDFWRSGPLNGYALIKPSSYCLSCLSVKARQQLTCNLSNHAEVAQHLRMEIEDICTLAQNMGSNRMKLQEACLFFLQSIRCLTVLLTHRFIDTRLYLNIFLGLFVSQETGWNV